MEYLNQTNVLNYLNSLKSNRTHEDFQNRIRNLLGPIVNLLELLEHKEEFDSKIAESLIADNLISAKDSIKKLIALSAYSDQIIDYLVKKS